MRNDIQAVLNLVDQRLDVLSRLLRGQQTPDPFGLSLIDRHSQRAARDEFAFLRTILVSGADHAPWAMLVAIDERMRRLSFLPANEGTADVVVCALQHLQSDASRCIADGCGEDVPARIPEHPLEQQRRQLEELVEERWGRDKHDEVVPQLERFIRRALSSPVFLLGACFLVLLVVCVSTSVYENRYEIGRTVHRKLSAYIGEQTLPNPSQTPVAEPRKARKSRDLKSRELKGAAR